MPVSCLDGEISDEDLHHWQAGPLDVRVELTRAQVCAVFCGPCLARGVAMRELNTAQLLKLFPPPSRRKVALRLLFFARRLSGARVRAVLGSATWHQLRAAAKHHDEDAQIRAAFLQAVTCLRTGRRRARGGAAPIR